MTQAIKRSIDEYFNRRQARAFSKQTLFILTLVALGMFFVSGFIFFQVNNHHFDDVDTWGLINLVTLALIVFLVFQSFVRLHILFKERKGTFFYIALILSAFFAVVQFLTLLGEMNGILGLLLVIMYIIVLPILTIFFIMGLIRSIVMKLKKKAVVSWEFIFCLSSLVAVELCLIGFVFWAIGNFGPSMI